MNIVALHLRLAVTLSLVGALGCKDGFDVGTSKPDSAATGGQVGNSGTGGSVGSGGGPGTGGISGTALATGGSTGTGGAGGTVPFADARSVEDARSVPDARSFDDTSAVAPDIPVTEPDRAADVSTTPPDAGSICSLPADMGPCDGVCLSYWYNQATGRCEQFGWGCCGGNANRFDTLEACMSACAPGLADAAAMDGSATGSRDAGGMEGATEAGAFLGMACTTSEECPSDAICCDASDPFCDGTLLPVGDSADPGEFVVSADGMTVTDTVTGLIWQRDGSGARPGCSVDGSLRCTWPEAQAYCASLVLGGVSGWRLPGWNELFNITDLTKEPGIATIDLAAFPDTPSESFWAFQGFSGSSSSSQMYVSFSDATVDYTAQASLRVRCVRGARCYPKSRFVVLDAQDNADGLLVRDTLTGLVWQQLTDRPPPMCRPWADAQSYCSSLGGGFRLPTLKEVHTTLTVGLILDRTFFQTSECKIAWTSSPYGGPDPSVTGYARVRDEVGMNPYNWNRLDWLRGVRCVR